MVLKGAVVTTPSTWYPPRLYVIGTCPSSQRPSGAGATVLRCTCDRGVEGDGSSLAPRAGSKQTPCNEEASAAGLCSSGALKEEVWARFGGMCVTPSTCHLAGPKPVQRQLARSRDGHSGHPWVACGLTFIAMISHHFS